MSKLVLYSSENKLSKKFKLMHNIYYYRLIDIYLGKTRYYPHFDKIFVLYDKFNLESIQMIYNMVNVNGKLYLTNTPQYKNFFTEYKLKNNFYIIQKKTNIQYPIPTYRIVDFMIIGVNSSIDLQITQNLSTHQNINISNISDSKISHTHFFDINWQYGIEYYKSFFDYSKKIVGEKTASLLYLDHTFPLIYSVNPHVKLIIILVNPAYRAFYHYNMTKNRWGGKKTFEELIDDELNDKFEDFCNFYTASIHYIKLGFYYKQLIKLFKWFPRYNILILLENEIFKDPTTEFNKISEFFNIDSFTHVSLEDSPDLDSSGFFKSVSIKERSTLKMDDKLYNKLMNLYKDDILKLEDLLNIKTNWI
jgi:hypothetical protein